MGQDEQKLGSNTLVVSHSDSVRLAMTHPSVVDPSFSIPKC